MKESREIPRVLLLSAEAPHSGTPGGVVLQRLFSAYPPDRLLVVTNNPPPSQSTVLACRYERLRLGADPLRATRFAHWRPVLRSLGGSAWQRLSRIQTLLGEFKPDLVVTLMQDSWFYDLAARYADAQSLPLVLLVHDLSHGFETVPASLKRRQLDRDRKVVVQASARLCISEPMAGFFRQTFGVRAGVLLPPRSESPVSQDPAACAKLKAAGRLTLGYAGGLHYGYGEQLLRLLPVLRSTGTRVEMFGPRPSGIVSPLNDATDVFTFHGLAPTPEDAWRGLLEHCDALIQPYLNPPGFHELQYRTHFPSKLGDALSLGLPLLVTGPEFASGLAWCAEHPGSALVVTDASSAALSSALVRLRDDSTLRVALARQAQDASSNFDAARLRGEFMDILASQTSASHRSDHEATS